jgi:putative CocE/NonD family hydrolase
VQQPLDETSQINSIKYATGPLTRDLELTGPMAMHLYASIDQEDTNWQVKMFDVDEYGVRRAMLLEDWLKASHRAVDESKSEPWWPWHPHTKNEPITPGQVYEYRIGLAPKSHVFKAGHRIEVQIASMDDVPGGLHICSSKTTLHKVYHNPEYASYLLLPVIPQG